MDADLPVDPVDPSTIPHRGHGHTPKSARPTPRRAAEQARLDRPVVRGRHRGRVKFPPESFPPDVRLVPDLDGVHLWTDPYGACILAGVTRRTIYDWKQRGWLKIRYMASAKMEIRVDSLWWSPAEREAVRAPVAGAMPAILPTPAQPPDDESIDTE